ncbi:MAG: hypothetical protein IKN91_03170 [Paludibacteraceae bacterium]|nr:hypothetical protein [Paludibacteraceae bacterium]
MAATLNKTNIKQSAKIKNNQPRLAAAFNMTKTNISQDWLITFEANTLNKTKTRKRHSTGYGILQQQIMCDGSGFGGHCVG